MRAKGGSGSIPAHAGEPSPRLARPRPSRVYPRARGGAIARAFSRAWAMGLSPRTRGSLQLGRADINQLGSIPAHAGEPGWPTSKYDAPRVYPRARGGAYSVSAGSASSRGLSPRTRGSLPLPALGRLPLGSIPAHAGEPRTELLPRLLPEVYPRARGGAGVPAAGDHFGGGLSPRTRGSRRRQRGLGIRPWSIPAHAGEPGKAAGPPPAVRVYPRARGGASSNSGRVAVR